MKKQVPCKTFVVAVISLFNMSYSTEWQEEVGKGLQTVALDLPPRTALPFAAAAAATTRGHESRTTAETEQGAEPGHGHDK